MNCKIHPDVELVCMRCFSARGGKSDSRAKVAASRKNGALGGRPRLSKKEKLARKLARAEEKKLAGTT
jgi:hypothetical protein